MQKPRYQAKNVKILDIEPKTPMCPISQGEIGVISGGKGVVSGSIGVVSGSIGVVLGSIGV
jgi:hypothetical protein